MNAKLKKYPASPPAARMVEDIVGCKWSLAVLGAVRFGILEKRAYAEVPPRVEYRLTRFGERFSALMDGVERLQGELDSERRG